MEKFECAKCGCYFHVEDRDNFNCPNCEAKEEKISFSLAIEIINDIITDYKDQPEKESDALILKEYIIQNNPF